MTEEIDVEQAERKKQERDWYASREDDELISHLEYVRQCIARHKKVIRSSEEAIELEQDMIKTDERSLQLIEAEQARRKNVRQTMGTIKQALRSASDA